VNALKRKLIDWITMFGPISVAFYMDCALGDPDHGYYITRDPLGRDFITAPEVSQIFGELIGLFFVQAWEDRGEPARFHFVELGPGRGTLMADMLRAASKVRPKFVEAAQVTLVETSPVLRDVQAQTLSSLPVNWASQIEDLSADAPLFLIANEFFDTFGIRQFVKAERGWHERMVTTDGNELQFTLSPDPVLPPTAIATADVPTDSVIEVNEGAAAFVREISARLAKFNGVALVLDYGYGNSAFGDTLQAVKANSHVHPLAEPGEADLTAHVDFAALARAAQGNVKGPMTQAEFLDQLGIRVRAEILKRRNPDHAAEVEAAVSRLTDPSQMGTLFKVLAICEGRNHRPCPVLTNDASRCSN
jgi:NADH dehydrogenase [ubiquinone] 1 alpha subcomplex assembly factor 7